jgi:VIT1/CCC1 family predicted Fe2+/Mn2+ transporter
MVVKVQNFDKDYFNNSTMNFSSIKNIPTIYLYLLSVISFVLSNVVRDKNMVLYYILLVLGAALFIFGFLKSRNKKE